MKTEFHPSAVNATPLRTAERAAPTQAELIAVRICHDLAGVVSAFSNGAEILGDVCGSEPGLARSSIELLKLSAADASARLRLFRRLFGYDSCAFVDGAEIDDLLNCYLRGFRVQSAAPGETEVRAAKALLAFTMLVAKALQGKENTFDVRWNAAGDGFRAHATAGRMVLLSSEEHACFSQLSDLAAGNVPFPAPEYKTTGVALIAELAAQAGTSVESQCDDRTMSLTFGPAVAAA